MHGFTLIEVLIYIVVLAVIMGAGYAALFRSLDHSVLLRGGADDIANALHAGENWRADVRASRGALRVETNGTEHILLLPGPREVSYRFATNTVLRRLGNNDWSMVLGNIETSAFVADPRGEVPAWRWELALKPRAKKPGRIRPLFTFLAVPAAAPAK
jgi:prepilin-type N-terminal cleavage/methylation domain-containing protein